MLCQSNRPNPDKSFSEPEKLLESISLFESKKLFEIDRPDSNKNVFGFQKFFRIRMLDHLRK